MKDMMKKAKRMLAYLIVLVMCVDMVSQSSFISRAQEATEKTEGKVTEKPAADQQVASSTESAVNKPKEAGAENGVVGTTTGTQSAETEETQTTETPKESVAKQEASAETEEGIQATADEAEVTEKTPAEVFKAAIDAANTSGGTVTMTESVAASITITGTVTLVIPEGVTLTNDAAQHTITVANGGHLTIDGTGTVDNVSHEKAALLNQHGGTVDEIKGNVTFTRSKEAGTNNSNGGNSYYTISNEGNITKISGGTFENKGGYSSLFNNGWDKTTNERAVITEIAGGTFEGGRITLKNSIGGEIGSIHNAAFTGRVGDSINYVVILNYDTIGSITNTTITGSGQGLYNAYSYSEKGTQIGSSTVTATLGEGVKLVSKNVKPAVLAVVDNNAPANVSVTTKITGGEYYVMRVSSGYDAVGIFGKAQKPIITGGIFSGNISGFVAEGYRQYSDGRIIGGSEADPGVDDSSVAKIGDKGYTNLQAAVNVAQANGGTVELIRDLAENIDVTGKLTLVVSEGVTLTNATVNHTINVKKGGSLVIDGEGTVDNINAKAPLFNCVGGTITDIKGNVTFERSKETEGNTYYTIANQGTIIKISGGIFKNKGTKTQLFYNDKDIQEIAGGTFQYGKGVANNRSGGKIVVKGGIFSSDVSTYVASGYKQNSDYTVVSGGEEVRGLNDAVEVTADGTKKYYVGLQNAISAVQTNGTVTLLKNVTDSITISSGKTVTLDLNGKTLTGTTTGGVMTNVITNSGTLNIKDSVGKGFVAGGLVKQGTDAKFSITGGTFKSSGATNEVANLRSYLATGYQLNKNGLDFAVVTGSAHKHIYEETKTGTSATCEKGGTKISTCVLCNDKKTEQGAAALGHNWKNGVCTRDGKWCEHKFDKTGDVEICRICKLERVIPKVVTTKNDKEVVVIPFTASKTEASNIEKKEYQLAASTVVETLLKAGDETNVESITLRTEPVKVEDVIGQVSQNTAIRNINNKVDEIITSKAKEESVKIAYLDINLYKNVKMDEAENTTSEPVGETKAELSITVSIPKDFNASDEFKIARNHDGVVTLLDCQKNAEARTLTFKTDKFSMYAIASYQKKAAEPSAPATEDKLSVDVTKGTNEKGETIVNVPLTSETASEFFGGKLLKHKLAGEGDAKFIEELLGISNAGTITSVNLTTEMLTEDKVVDKKTVEEIKKRAEEESLTVGKYLDINLYKVETGDGDPVKNTKKALAIKIPIPEEFVEKNYGYKIIRFHEEDGEKKITTLDAKKNADGKTLTFETDQFSVYAIATYEVAATTPSGGNNGGGSGSSNDNSQPTQAAPIISVEPAIMEAAPAAAPTNAAAVPPQPVEEEKKTQEPALKEDKTAKRKETTFGDAAADDLVTIENDDTPLAIGKTESNWLIWILSGMSVLFAAAFVGFELLTKKRRDEE